MEGVRSRRFSVALAGLSLAAANAAMLPVPAAAAGANPSLYTGAGPRPGPDILYAAPPDAPQLQNAPGSGWSAQPLMIAGATAYRGGEFLYQDYIFDDLGAAGTMTY